MNPSTLLSLPLLALALGGFVVGSSEFNIMGLLPEVAQDLSVSLSDAGLLVSAQGKDKPSVRHSSSTLRRHKGR